MMQEIYISIIIPVYNPDVDGFKRCWDSIRGLSIPVEYIFVDDGSKKGIEECIEYTKIDSRVKWIRKENGGVSSARNCGMEHVKGRYVLFVDADDELNLDFIDFLNDTPCNLEDDWITFDLEYYDIHRRTKEIRKTFPELTIASDEVGQSMPIDTALLAMASSPRLNESCGKLISFSFLTEHKISFPQGVPNGEDAYFNTQILKNTPTIRYIPITAYIYWYDSNNMDKRLWANPKKIISDSNDLSEQIQSVILELFGLTKSKPYFKALKIKKIIDFGRWSLALADANMLDNENKALIVSSLKRYNCFEMTSLNDFKGMKNKIYYITLKYHLWLVIMLLAKIRGDRRQL